MTNMKRLTVSLPEKMAAELDALKRTKEFKSKPYSELLRAMIQIGLEKTK